jgi:hypothetical protein
VAGCQDPATDVFQYRGREAILILPERESQDRRLEHQDFRLQRHDAELFLKGIDAIGTQDLQISDRGITIRTVEHTRLFQEQDPILLLQAIYDAIVVKVRQLYQVVLEAPENLLIRISHPLSAVEGVDLLQPPITIEVAIARRLYIAGRQSCQTDYRKKEKQSSHFAKIPVLMIDS